MKLKNFIAVLFACLIAAFPVAADDVYDSAPAFSPYYEGKLKSEVLNEALKELNYIRGLVGVSNNVTLNSDYTNKAQHGAVLLDAVDTMTHTPGKPLDMSESFYQLGYAGTSNGNIATRYTLMNGVKSGNLSLSQSTKMYMDDSDSSNISRVGHRRWLMNPRMKYVGFGLSTRRGYAVTYVNENFSDFHNVDEKNMTQEQYADYQNWLKWPISDEFITWPTHKNSHPLTYFDSETAWSVTLNSEIFEKSNSNSVRVKLTRLSDNKSWNFSSSNSDGVFYDNQESYAYDECIIFRPNNILSYNNGEKWRVDVSGLTRKDGTSGNISYNVNFSSESTGYEDDSYSNQQVIYNTEGNKGDSGGGGGCNAGLEIEIFALIILGIPLVKNASWK